MKMKPHEGIEGSGGEYIRSLYFPARDAKEGGDGVMTQRTRTEGEAALLRSRAYLYATEFFAGMSVMAAELGASRLLAPYFSSSQIVWTIIIGTIMIALALGNLFGGRWADRDADPARLYRRILIAALWLAAIPVLGKYVIVALTGMLIVAVDTNLLIWAAFLSCMTIFVFPLFLLGTVTPSLVKYATDSLDDNGRVVGNLSAFNTVGSILGTFLPTFVTIPAAGTAATFLIFAGILLALGLVYFYRAGTRRLFCLFSVAAFLVCVLLGRDASFAFWEKGLAYEGESVYNYLQVRDDERCTIFSTNVMFSVQSKRVKDGSLTGMYFDYALAAPTLAGGRDILILGMGTGTFAEQCRRYFPGARVAGVEIDEKITMLARSYFALPDDVPVTTYDGRAFLRADGGRYDVIMVDAFRDITIPFQMSSVEFFRLVREHLAPGGVMTVNLNMRAQGEGNINERLIDTIAAVFPAIRVVEVRDNTNLALFAAAEEATLERLSEKAPAIPDAELSALMCDVASEWQRPAVSDRVLTDDRAPVELLGMRAIDGIIQNELAYYKDVYRRDGLDGLMRSF